MPDRFAPGRRTARAQVPLASKRHHGPLPYEEWGVPVHDDRRLFEVPDPRRPRKRLELGDGPAERERYREAFDGFDASRIAGEARKVARCSPIRASFGTA